MWGYARLCDGHVRMTFCIITCTVAWLQDLLAYCDKLNENKADKEYVQMEVDVVSVCGLTDYRLH